MLFSSVSCLIKWCARVSSFLYMIQITTITPITCSFTEYRTKAANVRLTQNHVGRCDCPAVLCWNREARGACPRCPLALYECLCPSEGWHGMRAANTMHPQLLSWGQLRNCNCWVLLCSRDGTCEEMTFVSFVHSHYSHKGYGNTEARLWTYLPIVGGCYFGACIIIFAPNDHPPPLPSF